MDTLKAEQITGSKWRVLAIPFAGPFKGKDLDGEYFDRDTDIKPHWFKARPVMFQHGQDITAKDEDYGEQELDANPEDEGWWGTVWLNRSARYWAEGRCTARRAPSPTSSARTTRRVTSRSGRTPSRP
jgi:hypothetical protein